MTTTVRNIVPKYEQRHGQRAYLLMIATNHYLETIQQIDGTGGWLPETGDLTSPLILHSLTRKPNIE